MKQLFEEFDYWKTDKKWSDFKGTTMREYADWLEDNLKLRVKMKRWIAHNISWRLPYRLIKYFP